jgi:hypothetical protein
LTSPYPASIDSFTTLTNGTDWALAEQINPIYTGLVAVQTAIGLNPKGNAADLVTRLVQSIDADGHLCFAPATVLTIASGSITATQNRHQVTTESSAATDDLDTITDVADGFLLILNTNADNRQVRIRHGVGNILCANGQDIYLRRAGDVVFLQEDDALGYWLAFSFSPAGLVRPSTALTSNTTLTSAHNVLRCDASGGAFTVTLPAVAISTDWEYTLIKVDDSANAVTIDGNSAELVNFAATYALSTQGAHATIHCDATQWLITG